MRLLASDGNSVGIRRLTLLLRRIAWLLLVLPLGNVALRLARGCDQ